MQTVMSAADSLLGLSAVCPSFLFLLDEEFLLSLIGDQADFPTLPPSEWPQHSRRDGSRCGQKVDQDDLIPHSYADPA